MSKYTPLYEFLIHQTKNRIHMTFTEIEEILGKALPESAFKHRPWWANDRKHSHAQAWLDAGYKTEEVNMTGRRLVFQK